MGGKMFATYEQPQFLGLNPKMDPIFVERAMKAAKKIIANKSDIIMSRKHDGRKNKVVSKKNTMIPIVLIAGAGIAGVLIFKKMGKGK
jgi:hypothetical protein